MSKEILDAYRSMLARLQEAVPQCCVGVVWDIDYSISMRGAISTILSCMDELGPENMGQLQLYCEAAKFIGEHDRLEPPEEMVLDLDFIIKTGLYTLGYEADIELTLDEQGALQMEAQNLKHIPVWKRMIKVCSLINTPENDRVGEILYRPGAK